MKTARKTISPRGILIRVVFALLVLGFILRVAGGDREEANAKRTFLFKEYPKMSLVLEPPRRMVTLY